MSPQIGQFENLLKAARISNWIFPAGAAGLFLFMMTAAVIGRPVGWLLAWLLGCAPVWLAVLRLIAVYCDAVGKKRWPRYLTWGIFSTVPAVALFVCIGMHRHVVALLHMYAVKFDFYGINSGDVEAARTKLSCLPDSPYPRE
ncbi:MAG: hypothetical protein ABUL49_00770 [bacterium]